MMILFERLYRQLRLPFAMVWLSLLVLCLLNKAPLLAANSATQLRFDPLISDLTVNNTVTVTVQVVNVQNLFGLELDVLFDPRRVTIESIAPGDFLSADFVVKQTVDSSKGIASLAYTQLAKEPRNGSGAVAVLTLRPTDCLFSTTVQLNNSILSDNNGLAIPHSTMDGAIQNTNAGEHRTIAGTIFQDTNANGMQDGNDVALDAWPIFIQPYLSANATLQQTVSSANGLFQFDTLDCGTHTIWSKNGATSTPVQSVSLPAATNVLTVSIPITGSLTYPFQRVFMPGIERAGTP